MAGPTLRVLESQAAVARSAAQWVHDRAWAAANARGRFTLALSGGSTPKALYRQMAAGPAAALGPDAVLLRRRAERPAGPSGEQLPDGPRDADRAAVRESVERHRIRGELPAEEAAAEYEQTLRRRFPGTATFPRLDLVLLGWARTATPPRSSRARRRWASEPGGWWRTGSRSSG